MNFILKPEFEEFIREEIRSGKYQTAIEVIEAALQLLEKRQQYDRWVEEIRDKIDLAAAQLDRGEGVDGETAIARIRERLYRSK